jgi:beta-N-acetylhexosaminidase
MAKVDLTKQPYNLDAEDIKWVEDSIASMSIDEKIGQLFFNMGASTEPEYLKDVLDTYHISGVRYNKSKANVSGTENSNLNQGHVIADSLGGVSNAYNITPQDSVLNRHGDQAYMERNIV